MTAVMRPDGEPGRRPDDARKRPFASGNARDRERAAVRADIARHRADLKRTVEALAAKTRSGAPSQAAARCAAAEVNSRFREMPGRLSSQAVHAWHTGLAVAVFVPRHLSGAAAAVLAGLRHVVQNEE